MGKWTVSGHPLSGAALQMERDVHRADVASPGDEPSAAIRAGQHRHGGMRWQGSRAVQRLLCGGCGCRGALRRGQSSRHHCRNTGRGRGGFSRSGFRGDDKLPHPQQQKRRQARKKDRTSHMLHRASSLLPKNEICPLHELFIPHGHTYIYYTASFPFRQCNKRTFPGRIRKNPLSRTKNAQFEHFRRFCPLALARQM